MNEESGNEGSSPDIVIARLSFDKDDNDKNNDNESNNATEDDAKSTVTITEFNVNEDNNVLIEKTDVISDIKNDYASEKFENLSMEEKKKGRLKNSFKDRLFKRKKTKSFGSQPSIDEIEPGFFYFMFFVRKFFCESNFLYFYKEVHSLNMLTYFMNYHFNK